MAKRTVREVDVQGKRVLVRVDFNVLDEDGNLEEDFRIQATLPTINYLLEQNAKVVLMSHCQRPKGKVVEKWRLDKVAMKLEELLKESLGKRVPVHKLDDCVSPEVEAFVGRMQPGDVCLLENLRFHAEEESKDKAEREEFASKFCVLADVYVNDAFGASHRKHASVVEVPECFRRHGKSAVAGLLVMNEIEHLNPLLQSPPRPFVALLGGLKVSDKIGALKSLLERVDMLLIGGAMLYPFLKAVGIEAGKPASALKPEEVEKDIKEAQDILVTYLTSTRQVKLVLPQDLLVADRDADDASTKQVSVREIPANMMGMDIGPLTVDSYAKCIREAKTVFWNGPMGRFEKEIFANGTCQMAAAIAQCQGTTVAGGGETVMAILRSGLREKLTWLSTGGGASLEYLESASLVGIEALDEK